MEVVDIPKINPMTHEEKQFKIKHVTEKFMKKIEFIANPKTIEEHKKKLEKKIENINKMETDKMKEAKINKKIENSKYFTRCKKIRIYPSKEQKEILQNWFGASRRTYNSVLSKIKNEKEKINFINLRNKYVLNNALPEEEKWLTKTPKDVRAGAVMDLCNAYKTNLAKIKNTNKKFEMKFRKKKNIMETIVIPKSSITIGQKGVKIYPTFFNGKEIFMNKNELKKLYDTKSKEILIGGDCRMSFHKTGKYTLIIPILKAKPTMENQHGGIIALDPGVRTYVTGYEFTGECIKLGEGFAKRIIRLGLNADKLQSKIASKDIRCKERLNLRKALRRLTLRIKQIKNDLHLKMVKYLCDNYSVILLPEFKLKCLIKNCKRRREMAKQIRGIINMNFYEFSERLKAKAEERGVTIIRCNEAFTSKTCSNCGHQNNIKGQKILTCGECKVRVNRDINGARNIMLRALGACPIQLQNWVQ